jgi:hypothetical protein
VQQRFGFTHFPRPDILNAFGGMADFVANLDRINALAENSRG